ncbi:ornithine carbamoyltransferase subunit F [Citrobacter koseri]|uniref:Ornithine carbamoyltransferase subunit F n=1 Tax=Citrobacter koseri TaxID=545 RepID=A0A2X2VAE4_CITKO|nr:ornithine carbamoyltransferase subunit F [Citrobacter koseri]
MSTFYQKHFLKLLDFTSAELTALLQLAAKLKADKKNGVEVARLTGKKHRAHLRKRLDPHPMLFRSCRIRSGRSRNVPWVKRQPDWA